MFKPEKLSSKIPKCNPGGLDRCDNRYVLSVASFIEMEMKPKYKPGARVLVYLSLNLFEMIKVLGKI